MTLPLRPEMLEAAYNYLKATPPFCRWKLPDSDDVEFRVTADTAMSGWHRADSDKHVLAVSEKLVGHSINLIITIAHEMCHMRQAQKKMRDIHGAGFQRLAKHVCRFHGFDPKEF